MLSDSIFYIPPKTENIQKAIIMLHGYSSNGNDLISMAPYMAKSLPNTVFYAPNAPLEVQEDVYKWFDLEDYIFGTIYERFDYLNTLMERAKPILPMVFNFIQFIAQKHKLNSNKIALMGFSQGGLMALMSGLLYEDNLLGIIGSSAIPVAINDVLKINEIKNKPNVLLTHGTADDVVPYLGMQINQNTLKDIGCEVQTHVVSGMGHEIDNSCVNKMIEFIQKN
ncbi:MAG: hypothetical protein J6Y03_02050 [Alphaproteobacteria bacterium]|nr:hypothetical protein [Alphaproteobacteria bacterium]